MFERQRTEIEVCPQQFKTSARNVHRGSDRSRKSSAPKSPRLHQGQPVRSTAVRPHSGLRPSENQAALGVPRRRVSKLKKERKASQVQGSVHRCCHVDGRGLRPLLPDLLAMNPGPVPRLTPKSRGERRGPRPRGALSNFLFLFLSSLPLTCSLLSLPFCLVHIRMGVSCTRAVYEGTTSRSPRRNGSPCFRPLGMGAGKPGKHEWKRDSLLPDALLGRCFSFVCPT